jgi:4-diphosphocytidyl-2-C-methyl-D-erythritol kinase
MARGEYVWVFAVADRGLSTPRVYAECDRLRAGRRVPAPRVPDALMEALLAGDAPGVGASLTNDLQPAAVSLRPELDIVMDVGRDGAALGTVLSGSGPTVAFLVADDEAALDLAVSLSASGFCRGVVRASGPAPGARVRER